MVAWRRRQILTGLSLLTGVGALAAAGLRWRRKQTPASEQPMIQNSFSLDFQWPTSEPFLFCVHHHDLYPQGTKDFGPRSELLAGRDIGQDFQELHGFRMYHGERVPGFPVHPHRGFETITIVRKGYVDHADSLGAAGRYGQGDVQWMTAGAGVQHSEMFPLLKEDEANTLELFQIWLNLPRRSKMVPAHFTMHWSEKIPRLDLDEGRVNLSLIAGGYGQEKSLPPPPDSWAADPKNEVAIYLVKMQKGGKLTLPGPVTPANRTLYFFAGAGLQLNDQSLPSKTGFNLASEGDLHFTALQDEVEFLILQAKPIGEPLVQHGPFVMNSREEIMQTFEDYQRTQFGGWSWPRQDMVHGPVIERFARFPDGRIEKPSQS